MIIWYIYKKNTIYIAAIQQAICISPMFAFTFYYQRMSLFTINCSEAWGHTTQVKSDVLNLP